MAIYLPRGHGAHTEHSEVHYNYDREPNIFPSDQPYSIKVFYHITNFMLNSQILLIVKKVLANTHECLRVHAHK